MWDSPRGEYDAFEVQYLNAEGFLIQNLTQRTSIVIGDLKPHRNYTFTVIVRSGTESSVLRRSLPVSAIFQTHESLPGKVTLYFYKSINCIDPRILHIVWFSYHLFSYPLKLK